MAEDNCQTSNCNLLSKSVESSIKIDSISIDLISANEETGSEKCEHFSIRGFVSEIRKKDWKMCWPFNSDVNNNQHEGQSCVLPPLHVPRFKFWRCQNCLQEFDAKCITNNQGPELKSCTGGLNSNSVCAHASVFGDATRMLSTYEQPPQPDILKGEKANASASANVNQTNELQPLCCMDMKEKSRTGVSSPTTGHGMRSKAKQSQEIDMLATVAMEVISSPKQKACSTDDKATEPKNHEVITLCNGSRPTEVGDAKFAEKQNSIKSTAKICGTKKDDSADQRCKELIADVTSGEARDIEGNPIAIEKSFLEGQPSVRLDVCDDASSESAEVMARNDLEDFSNDDSRGLQNRKRTRKVRLLTELLCRNGDGISNKTRNQDSLPSDIIDASAVIDKPSIPDGQTGHFKRGPGHSRKRKPPQDEEWRPIGMSIPNKVRKNGRILKRDVEDTVTAAGTEALEIAFARMNLHCGKKSHLSKDRIDRSSLIGKKKKQKTLNCDEGFPSASSQENVLNKTGDKTGDSSKVNAMNSVAFDLVNSTFRTREMDLFPLPTQRPERDHDYSKMKFKMPRVHNPQDSQICWNDGMQKEGSMGRNDMDVSRAGSVTHPFHLAPDASLDKALNLSLNSYMATQKFDLRYNPRLEDGRKSSLTWQGSPSTDQVMRKAPEVNYTENFRNVPRPAPIASVGRGSVLNSKKPAYGMPFPKDMQNFTPQVAIGSCSPMQQKDFCSTSSKGKRTVIQDSAMLLNGGNHVAGKGSEQVAIDDIPMEIVELMARNQYERCLPDSEYNKRQLESANSNRSSQVIDFSKVHGHRELSLFKQEAAQKQMYQIRTGRNGVIERHANAGPTRQNPVDYFAQADRNKLIGQQEQAHNPVGFRPFREHRENPSSGVQHSLSSSKQNSAHSGKWMGDNLGKMSSQTSYPTAGSCNTCQSIPQQSKESKKFWSPPMPNQMPFVFGIPQNGRASSMNIDFLTHSPESLRKDNTNVNCDLKFMSQNVPNLGKQNRNLGSETQGGTRINYPFSCRQKGLEVNKKPVGSMDLYSNETIPAMHLLSLMDAGLRSSTPISMDVNQKFLKRPPVAPCRTDSGAYRTSNTMKLPPYAKSQVADSKKPIPGIPRTLGVSSSSSSFQHDRSFKRVSNFTSQASGPKEKRKVPDLCMPSNVPKLQASASTSVPFGTNYGSIPVHSVQNMFSAVSDPKVFPSLLHPSHNLKHKLDVPSAVVHVNSRKNSLRIEVCTINQNPADFTIPEARNVYMIAGEDLKFGMLVPLAKGVDITKPGKKKRPRVLATGKEQGRHPVP